MEAKINLNNKTKLKKLTYRTPDRFRRNVFRRNPTLFGKIRSLGGHR